MYCASAEGLGLFLGFPWPKPEPEPEPKPAMQGSSGLNSFLSRMVPFMRDRLLADPRYCFIVLAEVGIDTGCATVAEVRRYWCQISTCICPKCNANQEAQSGCVSAPHALLLITSSV